MTSSELLARLTADMTELQTLREALAVAAPGLSAPEALAQLLAKAEPERRASAGAETVRPPARGRIPGYDGCDTCRWCHLPEWGEPCRSCIGYDKWKPRRG